MANQKVTVITRGEVAFSSPSDDIQQLIGTWLSGRSEKTVRAYRGDLDDFGRYMGMVTGEAIGTLLSGGQGPANGLALGWKNDMGERGLSPATVNRRLAALRSVVKLARTLGMVPWGLDVENQKAMAYRDTAGPGIERFRAMLAEAGRKGGAKGRRDVAILRLLYDLGLREGELVALDVADLDLEQGRLTILGKGRSEKESLSLPPVTIQALSAWLEMRGAEDGPLFTRLTRAKEDVGRLSTRGVHKLVAGLGKRLGFEVRPHGIRHTAITMAVRSANLAGLDLSEVMQFSRHRDVRTLMVYRDHDRDVQGQLAGLVAGAAG
jgi:integrase/recombinase XerC